MNTSLESARAEVKFALAKQPGEKHAAIDGDGHTIYKLEFFARSVPPAWLDEIAAKLYHEHELGGYDKGGGPSVVWGVWALEFHYWVARQVKKADKKFHYNDVYSGRGRQAQEICEALAKWAAADDA